jgi:ribosomal protein L17
MSQPSFQGIDVTYKSQADNKDIRDLLVKLVPKAKAQMVEFSKQFKGRTNKETCKKIFDYIKSNFTYVADGGEQIIKLPSALLKKRVGDCKSYSLFTASILENLKIPYKFVYTSYNNNPIPAHVYVVTEDGCIIDAVYGIFNAEKKPTYRYTQDMNVRYMAGIGANCTSCNSDAMGKVTIINKDKRQQIKRTAQFGFDKFKSVAFVGGRQVLLGLIKGNYDGIATKMQKVDTNKLKNDWTRVGGDYSALTNAIKEGASKPAKKLGLLGKLKSLLKKKGIQGIGATDVGAIQAAIVAVATAVGSAIPAAGTAAGASVGAVLAELYPTILDVVKQTPASEEEVVIAPAATPADSTSFNFGSLLPIIAIGGAVFYFATKKK